MSRGSMLPAGLVLTGEIRGQGDLTIAGTVDGPVQIDGHLVIEPGASVRGDVKARSIVIRGTLIGPAIADETIKLESGARMVGDARAERVSVIEGALLRGRITMTGAQATRRSSAGAVPAAARPSPGPRELASPIARSSSGVLESPREEPPVFEAELTNRFVRPTDLQVPRSSAPPEPARPVAPAPPIPAAAVPAAAAPAAAAPPAAAVTAAAAPPAAVPPAAAVPAAAVPAPRPRRPPEPVIPGVGRQRARRKDGGMAS